MNGQVTLESLPVSWGFDDGLTETLPYQSTGFIDLVTVTAEDEENELTARSGPMRFAIRKPLDLTPDNSGRWTNLPNGDRIWLLGLHSEAAIEVGVTFNNLHIPKGAALYLYNPDKSKVVGALTDSNNHPSGILTTAKVPGDSLIIEYYEPYAARHQGSLRVRTLAHTYRQPYFDEQNQTCGFNPTCEEVSAFREVSSSVALMTVDDGTRYCTATLVNNGNFDGRPFMLVNSNCMIGDPNGWHFTFRYATIQCEGQTGGRRSYSISGAQILSSDENSNIGLIELHDRPRPNWNVFYAGWDASGVTPQQVAMIHHPFGGLKKIAVSNTAPSPEDINDAASFTLEGWAFGSSAEASTGAPLFNEGNRITSIMSSGFSGCGDSNTDFFNSLKTPWVAFSDFLDPFSQGMNILNGAYLGFTDVDHRIFKDNVALFPNPARDKINIINENDEAVLFVKVFDMRGSLILDLRYEGMSISLDQIPAGSYIVELMLENTIIRKKLLKV